MTAEQNTSHPTGFMLTQDEGDAYYWLGSLTINKLSSATTGRKVSIVDHRVPAGYAPHPHQHHDDEIFFIIDGQFAVRCGDDSWQAGPGSLVFLPAGVPHGFVVSDDGPGRTLLVNAPGGFDEVISELGTPATSMSLPGKDVPTPDAGRVSAVLAAHGITNVDNY